MKNHHKCPNCGREVTENEIYCYFCEFELSELKKKDSEAENKKPHGGKHG